MNTDLQVAAYEAVRLFGALDLRLGKIAARMQ